MTRAGDTFSREGIPWKEKINRERDSILIVNAQTGIIIKTNRQSERLFGKTRKKIIGAHYSSLLLPAETPKLIDQDAIVRLPPVAQTPLKEAITECINTREIQEIEHQIGESKWGIWVRSRIIPLESKGKINHLKIILTKVTERKRAEEALQEIEQRYRNQVEAMSDIIWNLKRTEQALSKSEEKYRTLYMKTPAMLESLDYKSNIVSVNDTFLGKTGYTRDEILGHNYSEFLTPTSRAYVLSKTQPEFLKTGENKDLYFQIVKKNGELMDILVSAIAERDESGKIIGALEIFIDITERKKAEDALKVSEEKYRRLYMKTPAMLESLDPKANITSANDAFLMNMGYSRDEVIGHKYYEFLTPTSRDYAQSQAMPELWKCGEHKDLNFQLVKKDGTLMDALITASAEKDECGNIVSVTEIITDITARKEAEEALRKSEEKYRTLFESNIVGVFLSDHEGQVHECNQAIAEIFGYTREELIQVRTPTLYVNPKDREYVLSMLDKNGEVENFETVMWKRNGTSFWVLFSAKKIPLHDKDHFLVTLIEIDQIKQAMQVLKDSQESILKLYEDALSISDWKTNLLTFASHELKTPLVPIIGWADFMLRALNKGKKLDDLVGMEELTSILQSARRLTTIINNFLDIGRIESNRLELNVEQHKTTVLMKNALESVIQLALSRKITINNHIQEIDIWVDGFRMEQIFINILSNAIKYSPEGTQVSVTSKVHGDLISIFFKDQGRGFTPEQLKEVWRPFSSKITQSTHDILPGTGIGLFLTKGLVERHHGTIKISSPGTNLGTIVKVTLPMKSLMSSESQS